MVISIRDAAKLVGISIIICCAVLVCTMFMGYAIDITDIAYLVTDDQMAALYDAQLSTAKVTCAITGGCLLATALVILTFYIKHYIDTHKKEIGILKALGYSNISVAKHFYVFGVSVLTGALVGFGGAYIIMPEFYRLQNADNILPEITVSFHPALMLLLVILPTLAFGALAVVYAALKLKRPPLELLRECPSVRKIRGMKKRFLTSSYDALSCENGASCGSVSAGKNKQRGSRKKRELTFIAELKRNTLREKKTLTFFIVFASFCFSAMTQMSFSMKELASFMMGAMMMTIGIILACTTLFLAITTVINGNTKTIAMMRAFGYSGRECRNTLLGVYRPAAYIGFAIGTLYQYALLKIMVTVFFRDYPDMPEYNFDFPMMVISLAAFFVFYELVMLIYARRINSVSVKSIMLET